LKIRYAFIDELLASKNPVTVMNQDGILGALLNRMMAAKSDHHLVQEQGETRAGGSGTTVTARRASAYSPVRSKSRLPFRVTARLASIRC